LAPASAETLPSLAQIDEASWDPFAELSLKEEESRSEV
jgi:hypothetical protein